LALEAWVEKGAAPDKIIAAKMANEDSGPLHATMTRPLCPYPQIAKYKGSGDDKDAANFNCAAPPR
jgi:feruloyl esterase